ncbi:MAG: putative metal-binding motif-containing protein [Flavobacteriales bacterium]|nr:putative metal-binding motif-containing protein [Flavobacteriales bacterium]
MKPAFFSVLFILFMSTFDLMAQQPAVTYFDVFGGTGTESNTGLCKNQGGGYVWVGYSNSADGNVPGNNGGYDFYLVKHTSADDPTWTKNYGGSEPDFASQIINTDDDGFIVIGSASSSDGDVLPNAEGKEAWVLKLNTSGNIEWQNLYSLPGTNDNVGTSICIVDGGYVLSGKSYSTDQSWLMKINESGQTVWTTSFPPGDESLYSDVVESTADGGIISRGLYGLTKLDGNGNVEWTSQTLYLESSYHYGALAVVETPGNDFVVPYYSGANIAGIAKFDENGTFLWDSTVPTSETDRGPGKDFLILDIVHSEHGGFLAVGIWRTSQYAYGTSVGEPCVESALIHFKGNGDFDWLMPIEFPNISLDEIVELGNGDLLLAGTIIDTRFDDQLVQIMSYDGIVMHLKWPTLSTAPLAIENTSVCAGETITVNADANYGWYPPYEIQLSDNVGDFSNPTVLLTTSEFSNQCTIPDNIPAGGGYRIRFVSLETGQVGSDNGQNIAVHVFTNPKFTESMGSAIGTVSIAAHEAADGFHQDGFTMSGNGSINNTQPSTGYENASGAANVFLGNSGSNNFIISGINTLGDDLEYLQFGLYMSSPFAYAQVEVSANGVNYSPLNFTPVGTGWQLITATGSIPNSATLSIRFTRFGILPGDVRIDDVRLIHDPENPEIDASGPTAFCGPGSVTLIAPSATSYLWNTGSTSQTINVNSTGDFTCTVGSVNGCDITLGPVHVQTTATSYFTDTDNDGYGDPASESLLCAPDETHTISTGGDCDDQNPAIHDSAIEICDGVDNDCDGTIDESTDADNDGYTLCQNDCNDDDSAINPGMTEIPNGVDDNCNGIVDESPTLLGTYFFDLDGDFYGDPLHPVLDLVQPSNCVANFLDCDDTDPTVYASAIEICGDGKDNNCDGIVDNCPLPECLGDLDFNGTVNIADVLVMMSAFGTICN